MDCRKTLWLGACLLAGAGGCAHQVAVAPSSAAPYQYQAASQPAPAPVRAIPANAVINKEADLPKKTPQASTCVAGGDFFAQQAQAPGIGETAKTANQEKARKAYQQALAIDPHCLQAYESLAALYVAMKDHAHAVATYQKAAQAFPKESRVFYDLGVCHGSEKEWEPAVQNLSHAAELDPENRKIVDALGWMLARAGRYDDSLATFMRVHDEAESHYRLALMLEHLKEMDLCKGQLRAALDKDPQLDKARAMLAQLNGGAPAAVQTTAFEEPSAPAPVAAVVSVSAPSVPAQAVILPPPPKFPIRYEQTAPVPQAPGDADDKATGGGPQ